MIVATEDAIGIGVIDPAIVLRLSIGLSLNANSMDPRTEIRTDDIQYNRTDTAYSPSRN